MPPSAASQPANIDLLRIDDQLTSEERLVRDTVRSYTADRVMPHIADWFEAGTLPRELVPELGKLGLAYLHIVHTGDERLLGDIRSLWKQSLIVNRPGHPRDQVGADVASGLADLEAYGQMVLANPDFVARLKTGAPMNEADRASFFGGTARGYTDYPALEAAA